jgi:ACS family D-galactonate transporter-like MFS transporter
LWQHGVILATKRSCTGGVRWLIIFLAFLGTSVSYIDRANLGVAMPYLQQELGLRPSTAGLALGAFFWTYALGQLPSGWFVDRVGPRIAYTVAVVWWSAFTAATALVRGFTSLFGLRLLLGAGEAPAYPTNAKVVSEWFPRSERAFATSIFDSGARVGPALALPLVSTVIAHFGWRASFLATGALGLLWALFWYRVYRHPSEHPWVGETERAHILDERASTGAGQGPTVRWRDLFRYRTVWGMMLGFFCLSFVIYFFITWFPSYLVKARGFTLLKMQLYGSIPALFAIPCGYLGGLFSDLLVRRGLGLTRARKIPIVGGMLLSSSIALAVIVPSAVVALALLSLCYGSLAFAAASVWSLPSDVAPTPGHVGSLGGIQNFASNLAGVSIAAFVGFMVERTGGFVVPLVAAGGFSVLGALSYLVIVGPIEPLRPPARDGDSRAGGPGD